MEFHASGKLWRRVPIAYTTSVNKSGGKSLKWKASEWFLASHLLPTMYSAPLGLHVQNPGFVTIRKTDVFTCEMLKLLTIREWSGWLPGKQLIHSLNISLKKQFFYEHVEKVLGTTVNVGVFFWIKTTEICDKDYSSLYI